MADTIERELKYCINTLPLSLSKPIYIEQYYFNPKGIESILSSTFPNVDLKTITTFRFRIIKDEFSFKNILTLKTQGLFERNEYEKEVDDNIKDIILTLPIISKIVKNRYIDSFNSFNFEFDEYLNLNTNLYTVEIELDDFNELVKSNIEDILLNHYNISFTDVTNDPSYKNANLIKKFGEKKI